MASNFQRSRSFTLIALAGLASSAVAGSDPVTMGDLVPTHKAGVLYVNLATGERTLTRYDAGVVPEFEIAHSTSVLFDYWMSLDVNPCWDDPREKGFAILADSTTDHTEPMPNTEPIVGFDFGDMPFDSRIAGVTISTVVLHLETVDSNNDGELDSGLDVVMAYYDALTEGNRTSIAPPTAVVRVESIPGNNPAYSPPGAFDNYYIVVDFGGSHFELGDSDLADLGAMNLPGAASGLDLSTLITTTTTMTTTVTTTTTTASGKVNVNQSVNQTQHTHTGVVNPTPDGLADFQYLQYYVKHGTDDKVTSESTFFGLGTPIGGVTVINTYVTQVVSQSCPTSQGGVSTCTVSVTLGTTILTPDPLPAGQSAFEGFGLGVLGVGGDVSAIDWSPGGREFGCCAWFGGVDCAGFLVQLLEEPEGNETYFNFVPFAQLSHGFNSFPCGIPYGSLRVGGDGNDSFRCSPCSGIDYNNDGFIDSGDIGMFIARFLEGDASADLNGDGFTDSGDIQFFIAEFLACSG